MTTRLDLAGVNALSDDAFVERFGALYEHSPWVAADAARRRPFASFDAMRAALSDAVRAAGPERQLALVRAHPELGHRAGIDPDLSRESRSEQGTVGLDRLTPDEYAHFRALNDAYSAKFAMPFVICVRRANKAIILDAMEKRLQSTPDVELATALAQIDMIAALRLEDQVDP
ncbi:2-oxo-4-hydroxy-4-carboxy-5-ureidoimidazoline decarboxylase [Tanticharoenia sakaeratensis]|uniref:2-oxo-4-hydroxy-4-carboxy-5-ureidoimidazoline decarboxylase n=1 Tax=Tanticharoenia sakaeratensis NBRC 103193 TaxID=1231623 RepID=A0A0D6MKP8_9PROT|nr:2-oxo-4-hydroxy-4-carboxy-5-ureidoimidazoline decarboxylase [Tanticharoenia sakaeratensis]GAN53838.1 hypothetical protein Tasa_012_014 [Tanticharoenia sakaeratensis NBRC 103193]GBQ25043.1 hypothetical protein AA103193_2947 [Tanticharoenia sakaeratensis NBRC 103193]